MRRIRGLVVRCGLMSLPLGIVIALCFLMFGFRGQAKSPVAVLPAEAVAVQNPLIPPAEGAVTNYRSSSKSKMAAFERLHIVHAKLNLPD
jgi:hypothetical protein